MFVRPSGTWDPLLTSFHRMEHGKLRSQIGTFKHSERYVVDIFCMAIVDVIMGQRDHKWHNYMVTPDERLFLFDNGDCLTRRPDWDSVPNRPVRGSPYTRAGAAGMDGYAQGIRHQQSRSNHARVCR